MAGRHHQNGAHPAQPLTMVHAGGCYPQAHCRQKPPPGCFVCTSAHALPWPTQIGRTLPPPPPLKPRRWLLFSGSMSAEVPVGMLCVHVCWRTTLARAVLATAGAVMTSLRQVHPFQLQEAATALLCTTAAFSLALDRYPAHKHSPHPTAEPPAGPGALLSIPAVAGGMGTECGVDCL
jgi:hypothetical protein